MTGCCYLTVTERGVVIESAYGAAFVEALKASVPHTARSWDPDQKKWIVETLHLAQVKELACKHYDSVWFLDRGAATDLKTGETMSSLFAREVQPCAQGRWSQGTWNANPSKD